jgi:DNA repair protein RecO (recombination protein O)
MVLNAYVLHHYDWSESSLILDVFSREQGRLALVARGAKRPHSQMRPILLPFQRVLLSLGRAPKSEVDPDGSAASITSEVQTVRSAEWAGGAAMLAGTGLFSGFYLNELLMKLLARQDAHALLFDAYAQTLPALASHDEWHVQAALRAFEITLLRETGVLPDLSRVTLTQEEISPHARYVVLPEAGVTQSRDGDASMSGAALLAMQAALSRGALAGLQRACLMALSDWRSVLRGLLLYHLGGRALRTRQTMIELQSLLPTPPDMSVERARTADPTWRTS